jgi:hypothetical protein
MVTCLGTWLLCYSFVSIQFLVAISTLATIEVEIAHWNFHDRFDCLRGRDLNARTGSSDDRLDWNYLHTKDNTKMRNKIWGFEVSPFFLVRFPDLFSFVSPHTNERQEEKNKLLLLSPPGKKLFSQPLAKLIKKRMVILLLLLFTKWRRRGRKRRRRGAIVGSCEVPHGSTWTECRQSGTSRRDS